MSRREEEFRELVAAQADKLHRAAYLLIGDWHLADDLVQETFVKAYRHWSRVQRADSPEAYLRRILVNNARNHWRRRVVREVEAAAHDAVSSDATEDVVRRMDLLAALLTLPARQRATVVLRYLEGMTERETAAVMRCSEGTVKSQTSRALAALRTHLSREDVPA